MLRTNSKKACENIRKYILDEDEDYIVERAEWEGKTLSTNDEKIAYIYDCLKDEMGWKFARCGEFQTFKDWAQGLALGGLFCYYYNRSAVADLGDILEESEEERSKYSEQQAEEMLTRLIFREVVKAHDRLNRARG